MPDEVCFARDVFFIAKLKFDDFDKIDKFHDSPCLRNHLLLLKNDHKLII